MLDSFWACRVFRTPLRHSLWDKEKARRSRMVGRVASLAYLAKPVSQRGDIESPKAFSRSSGICIFLTVQNVLFNVIVCFLLFWLWFFSCLLLYNSLKFFTVRIKFFYREIVVSSAILLSPRLWTGEFCILFCTVVHFNKNIGECLPSR